MKSHTTKCVYVFYLFWSAIFCCFLSMTTTAARKKCKLSNYAIGLPLLHSIWILLNNVLFLFLLFLLFRLNTVSTQEWTRYLFRCIRGERSQMKFSWFSLQLLMDFISLKWQIESLVVHSYRVLCSILYDSLRQIHNPNWIIEVLKVIFIRICEQPPNSRDPWVKRLQNNSNMSVCMS